MPSNEVTQDQATILQILEKEKEASYQKLVAKSGFEQVKIARIVLELSEAGYVNNIEKIEKIYQLTKEGREYVKKGLPEKQVITELKKFKNAIQLEEFKEQSSLKPKTINIAIGWLRKKGWVKFSKKDKKTYIEATSTKTDDIDEEVLKLIAEGKIAEKIKDEKVKNSIKNLSKRNLLEINELKQRIAQLTKEGEKRLEKGLEIQEQLETTLTAEMIITGSWKKKKFKAYDPTENVPQVYYGRKHPAIEVINELREIFLEMGFTEIRGPIVESEFWNFDALFQPQDHPARDMHDTFKIAKPKKADLPEKKVVSNVSKTHKNGWKTKSIGWQYKWKRSVAQKLCLRTHTTATTVRHLSKAYKEWTPPEKVFSIDRVYRNESIDYTHLAEFMQVEGIVVDKNVTLRNLMGLLKTFYGKMGFDKIRLIPSYYPYTEPSLATLIYVDKFNSWLEMGGSGIFRPEVTLPFGVKEKVLAWGQGLDRLVMLKLDLDDIREVYSKNIDRLRKTPIIF
jgi:phenylalanyl-tRNA synthetase alpha chain